MRPLMKTAPTIILLITFIIATNLTSAYAEDLELTVKVYTVDEKPLGDAYVKVVSNGDTKATGRTGSDGEISFNLPENEIYDIYVYYPAGHEVGSSEGINLTEPLSINVTVNVASKWTIYVYDGKERDPVPDANVTIIHSENGSIAYKKLTGSDGKVEFGPIPSDANYEVIVTYRGKECYSASKEVAIQPDKTRIQLPLYRVILHIIDRKDSPVEGVRVELREELDEDPIASTNSGPDGVAVLKLIPNGNYYLTAWLKGIKVYESDGKEIKVLNDDRSKEVIVNAVKLNVTVFDYDGEDKLSQYSFIGRLLRDGEEVGRAGSEDGVLRFGHTPFENYTLEVMLGDLEVYSGAYEVKLESAEGSVNAWFYDIEIEVNASALVNASIAKSLTGKLSIDQAEFSFETEDWRASLENLPRSSEYSAVLFYGGREVMRLDGLKISEEGQVLKLNLTGYGINVTTMNLDGKPVSANLSVILPGAGLITSFETDESGRGSSGKLLPLVYRIEARVDGMKVGESSIDLKEAQSVNMKLFVKDVVFKVLDKDGEEVLRNVVLKLVHGTLSKSGKSDENGTISFENLPVEEYRITVAYYGFKVLDDWIEITPQDAVIELEAPGVLDVELLFVDSEKKPLDQGLAVLSFGGFEVERNIGGDGKAVFKNLPNTTLTIEAFYKEVKLKLNPDEFNLLRDGMRIVVMSSVHSLEARILRGDGADLKAGQALLYLNGRLEKIYDLAKGNEISERLPEGEVEIELKYEGRDAGIFELYLEKSVRGLAIYSTVYPFELKIRNPEGGSVAEARLSIRDKLGPITEVISDEEGVIQVLLPAGSYEGTLEIENNTYTLGFEVRKPRSINFVYPVSHSMGFELTVAASAINLAISGYAISRLSYGKPKPERRRPRRRSRRIPRV